jgi:hypothetical protein
MVITFSSFFYTKQEPFRMHSLNHKIFAIFMLCSATSSAFASHQLNFIYHRFEDAKIRQCHQHQVASNIFIAIENEANSEINIQPQIVALVDQHRNSPCDVVMLINYKKNSSPTIEVSEIL